MELTIIIFLLGGLFLGWSLGANDAANVFGTAVGTRMVVCQDESAWAVASAASAAPRAGGELSVLVQSRRLPRPPCVTFSPSAASERVPGSATRERDPRGACVVCAECVTACAR